MEQIQTQTEEKDTQDYSFDLPVLDTTTPSKPRIHKGPGDSVCTSCEG